MKKRRGEERRGEERRDADEAGFLVILH